MIIGGLSAVSSFISVFPGMQLGFLFLFFFFFRQKTAYEFGLSLVGSEMGIRDGRKPDGGNIDRGQPLTFTFDGKAYQAFAGDTLCHLYPSYAADDRQCVDLGGRRIIKKNK